MINYPIHRCENSKKKLHLAKDVSILKKKKIISLSVKHSGGRYENIFWEYNMQPALMNLSVFDGDLSVELVSPRSLFHINLFFFGVRHQGKGVLTPS